MNVTFYMYVTNKQGQIYSRVEKTYTLDAVPRTGDHVTWPGFSVPVDNRTFWDVENNTVSLWLIDYDSMYPEECVEELKRLGWQSL